MSLDKQQPLAQAIQRAVQPKIIDNGWVAEENDTELSEYITLMVINGKTQEQVISEVGTELLGVGEDDPAVTAVAQWLFQQLPVLTGQVNGGGQQAVQQQVPAQADQAMNGGGGDLSQQQAQSDAPQPIPSVQDSSMDDATAPEGVPSGPKAMRNGAPAAGGRGRDRRMLGQLNRQLDRSHEDPLKRVRGGIGGQGRINSHAGRDPPKGPRGGSNVANGVQRMMNHPNPGAPMFQPQGGPPGQPGALTPDQQMQFLQMMEMQSQMMASMFNGQTPNMQGGGFQPSQRGGRGRGGKSMPGRGASQNNPALQHIHNGGMTAVEKSTDVDMEGNGDAPARKDPFDTLCRFNASCTVATCPYAHQSPAAPPGTTIDLSDRCSFGAACENKKCAGKHPSPSQRRQHLKDEVDCKFYPNCTNPSCPFRHPDMPACRNGADCTVPGCKFSHSKIMCRYNPCLNPKCPYKHAEGQKRGKFEDKVWTAEGGEGEGFDREAAMRVDAQSKTDRFQGLKDGEAGEEELILPGRSSPERGMDDDGNEGIVT